MADTMLIDLVGIPEKWQRLMLHISNLPETVVRCVLYLVLFVVVAVVSLLLVKWIGESDLPFWMKWWLLK